MLSVDGDTKLTTNPLATRYVAPGKLPWIGSGDTGLDSLVARFHELGRCCQIIGPHGSGKSTLLEHLVPLLGSHLVRVDVNGDFTASNKGQTSCEAVEPTHATQGIWWFRLRRGSAVMDRLNEFWRQKQFRGILVLDGGEQLSWWRRWRLKAWVRHRKCGLIVTSHADWWLTTLCRTEVTPQLAKEVIRQAYILARGESVLPREIEKIDWESWLRERQGNLRECLMDLYDQVESMTREAR